MERLTDQLTTTDAKLWADEFMNVKARLGEQEFDHAMMLSWFANAIMQGYDEGQRRAKANAQAQIEALQAQLESANALLHKKNCAIGKAEMAIEALQRERDTARRRVDELESREIDVELLQADLAAERAKVPGYEAEIRKAYTEAADWQVRWKHAQVELDAEREKVKGLHEVTKVICTHCCEPMEIPSKAVLQTQLTQLRALVRIYKEAVDYYAQTAICARAVDAIEKAATLARRRGSEMAKITQISTVATSGDTDTLYALDENGCLFVGWQERDKEKGGWVWVWKPVPPPEGPSEYERGLADGRKSMSIMGRPQ